MIDPFGAFKPDHASDTVTISSAELKAYRAAAKILLEAYPNASEDVDDECNCTQCRSERTVNALRAAGILEDRSNG